MYNFTVGKPPHNPKLLVRVSGFDHDKGNTLSSHPSTQLGNQTTPGLSLVRRLRNLHSISPNHDRCFFLLLLKGKYGLLFFPGLHLPCSTLLSFRLLRHSHSLNPFVILAPSLPPEVAATRSPHAHFLAAYRSRWFRPDLSQGQDECRKAGNLDTAPS